MDVKMKKNNIVHFPQSIDAQINHVLAWHDRTIAKYNTDIKKMNWFTAGLMTGILGTFFIFSCVYYFVGLK